MRVEIKTEPLFKLVRVSLRIRSVFDCILPKQKNYFNRAIKIFSE